MLETGFRKSHLPPRRISPLGCQYRALHRAASANCPDEVYRIQNATEQCISRSRFHAVGHYFHPSQYTINSPVGVSLETWLPNCEDRHVRYIAQGSDRSEII